MTTSGLRPGAFAVDVVCPNGGCGRHLVRLSIARAERRGLPRHKGRVDIAALVADFASSPALPSPPWNESYCRLSRTPEIFAIRCESQPGCTLDLRLTGGQIHSSAMCLVVAALSQDGADAKYPKVTADELASPLFPLLAKLLVAASAQEMMRRLERGRGFVPASACASRERFECIARSADVHA